MRSFICTILLSIFVCGSFVTVATGQVNEKNKTCLECHSSHTFPVYNEWTEREERRLMNPLYILDTVKLSAGVHNNFFCIDCHSMDYENYPHDAELKLEPLMTCIDCHGGDDTYASWKFDEIEQEYHKSVHYEKHGEQFSCTKCHSQHYYKPTARLSSSLNEIVETNNNMCLSCHDNMVRYQQVTGESNPQLVQIHGWLPNQALHFRRIRCIDCHTDVVDSLLVSHNILPKEKATRNCVECHSANSMLQASLYKYQNLQSRANNDANLSSIITTIGGVNSEMSYEYYLIGASRIPYLNLIYGLILLGTIAGIVIHIILRIKNK
ncbi:MAG TPA: cytochrome c3 family protein [Mariniphaga sp.]|nr:cytochrome c3 family protein [Mariniphaga sp.]